VALELPEQWQAVAADSRAVPDRHGGSGKVKTTSISCDGRTGHRVHDGTGGTVEGGFRSKVTAVGGHDGTADAIGQYRKMKQAPVTGRHDGADGSVAKDYSPPRRTLAQMLELQGFPPDWLDHQPWTMQAKRGMVGNGVPLPMSRALARAVVKALERAA
jgi:site-specific DNA-cytosine methylase